MTLKQNQLLSYIRDHIANHGHSPSYDDMAIAMRLASKSGIARLVDALVGEGHLRRRPYKARALELVDAAPMPDAELHRTIHTLTDELAAARRRIAELEART